MQECMICLMLLSKYRKLKPLSDFIKLDGGFFIREESSLRALQYPIKSTLKDRAQDVHRQVRKMSGMRSMYLENPCAKV